MNAGRELDAEVAERVMGFVRENGECWITPPPGCWSITPMQIPAYSTDIAAAWLVVERISRVRCFVQVSNTADSTWAARVGGFTYAEADTAPLAICRAALSAPFEALSDGRAA